MTDKKYKSTLAWLHNLRIFSNRDGYLSEQEIEELRKIKVKAKHKVSGEVIDTDGYEFDSDNYSALEVDFHSDTE